MAITRKEEARALSSDEQDLVARTHHPAVQEESDSELRDLTRLIRDRRNKARDMAHQRRREMRGKGEARGASASTADAGSRTKLAALSTALRRVNGEMERRRKMSARTERTQGDAGSNPKGAAAANSRHARQARRQEGAEAR